jgi:hypothetical protein
VGFSYIAGRNTHSIYVHTCDCMLKIDVSERSKNR